MLMMSFVFIPMYSFSMAQITQSRNSLPRANTFEEQCAVDGFYWGEWSVSKFQNSFHLGRYTNTVNLSFNNLSAIFDGYRYRKCLLWCQF